MKNTKPTPTQTTLLVNMSQDPRGLSLVPGGYSRAGADAARWWASMGCLERLGLVVHAKTKTGAYVGNGAYALTEAGRAYVATLNPSTL